MTIRLTGLSGGFDASGVIEQLVSIARQPIVEAEQKKLLVDQATSTVNAFSSRLSSFRSAALALSDTSGYASYGAASSDPAVVASASGGAQAGSYAIAVTQLASAQKLRSSTFASSSTALGLAGQLTVQVGSQTAVNVNVTATDTLSDVATKLAASGARITASVLFDGTSYRLSLQGADSGAANAFTVSQSGLDLGLANPANVYQTAKDAMLTVDGMAITRSTNSISGVIPGVTMALT
jgi:flagellar hook-associated protein 2